jgi:hypothetical protein
VCVCVCVCVCVKQWWNITDNGGNRSNRRETCPSATFSTTHFTWTELGSTPVFSGENPWIIVQSVLGVVIIRHGIAYYYYYCPASARCRDYKAWDCVFTYSNQTYVIVSMGRVFVTCCELEQAAQWDEDERILETVFRFIGWKDFVFGWAAEGIQPLKMLQCLSVGVLLDCHTLDSSVRGRGTVSRNGALIKRL